MVVPPLRCLCCGPHGVFGLVEDLPDALPGYRSLETVLWCVVGDILKFPRLAISYTGSREQTLRPLWPVRQDTTNRCGQLLPHRNGADDHGSFHYA